jgi:hypothetical protein
MGASARLTVGKQVGCSGLPEQRPVCAADDRGEQAQASAPVNGGAWPKLSWLDRLVVAATLLVVALVAVPRLPRGICFDDFGDLQLASETLGIMHPTGYAGYVTLGYLITRIPGVEPAYLVSLACLASGIIALWLCALMQVRLGVNAWVASAWCLVLAAHPKVWISLVAPEVYAPSLAFLAAAAYCVTRYACLGRRRHLLVAALLYGIALANRPPVLFTLPFFLIAWLAARKKWEASWRRSVASLATAALCAAVPVVYSVAFLWVRDRPDAAYNYIDQYNVQWRVLPDADAGWHAKMERIVWHMTGSQFKKYMGNSWSGVRSKLRWLRHTVFTYRHETILTALVSAVALGLVITFRRCKATAWLLCGAAVGSVAVGIFYRVDGHILDQLPPALAVVTQGGFALLAASGLVLTYHRCKTAAWVLFGMAVASVVFVCAYQMVGQSADILPLLFAVTVFDGVGVSPLLACHSLRVQRVVAVGFLLMMCATTVAYAGNRSDMRGAADAGSFVAELDIGTLPQDAVICTGWRVWPPLRYAQRLLTDRSDIEIINADPSKWLWMIKGKTDRPVFFTDDTQEIAAQEGAKLTRFRNLWRLESPKPEGESPRG